MPDVAAMLGYLFPSESAVFAARANEAAEARVWAGIHFRSDIQAGAAIGRSAARLVFERIKDDPGSGVTSGRSDEGSGDASSRSDATQLPAFAPLNSAPGTGSPKPVGEGCGEGSLGPRTGIRVC